MSTSRSRAQSVRVLIADDHPLIIEGLTAALKRYGINVIRHVTAAQDVVRIYDECEPDVLVLDVRFGGETKGLEIAAKILRRHDDAKIVIFTQFSQVELARQAYRLGALSIVPKSAESEILSEAIRAACVGEKYFVPEIAQALARAATGAADTPEEKLSKREFSVFRLLAQGRSMSEIAVELKFSYKTINGDFGSIKTKLGVENLADIVLLAAKHNIVGIDDDK